MCWLVLWAWECCWPHAAVHQRLLVAQSPKWQNSQKKVDMRILYDCSSNQGRHVKVSSSANRSVGFFASMKQEFSGKNYIAWTTWNNQTGTALMRLHSDDPWCTYTKFQRFWDRTSQARLPHAPLAGNPGHQSLPMLAWFWFIGWSFAEHAHYWKVLKGHSDKWEIAKANLLNWWLII